MATWEERIIEVSDILDNREHYQRKLGKLASEIADEFGVDKFEDFSRDLNESQGMTISPSTLKNYRWVWEKTKQLELPLDISYRTLQYIASSGKAEYWAERIKNEVLSSSEVYKLLRDEKGLSKKKTYVCKACGAENEI